MSNTDITNLQISDTFQTWVEKTNALIDLANENTLLVGPTEPGPEVQGNSNLVGTLRATSLSANTALLENITRRNNAADQISVNSPLLIRTTTNAQNAFIVLTLQSTSSSPQLRLINRDGSTWSIRQSGSAGSADFVIDRAGEQRLRLTTGGRVIATEYSGSGSLLTNLNATNITTGTIPAGVLPDSAKRGEIPLADLENASSSSQGFITGRRFRSALKWDFITEKPAIVSQTRTVAAGNGLTGGGDLSQNRTITLGTPGTLTGATTNSVTSNSHTHAITVNLSTQAGTSNVVIESSAGTNATIAGATTAAAGLVTTGNQSWSGRKTFDQTIRIIGTTDDNGTPRTGTTEWRSAIASGGNRSAIFTTETLTASRTYTFPNATGTVALMPSSWQSFTFGSVGTQRMPNTIYTNDTALPIMVAVGARSNTVQAFAEVRANPSSNWIRVGSFSNNNSDGQQFIVPPNHQYIVGRVGEGTLDTYFFWSELR
jgi:hypothetical protein